MRGAPSLPRLASASRSRRGAGIWDRSAAASGSRASERTSLQFLSGRRGHLNAVRANDVAAGISAFSDWRTAAADTTMAGYRCTSLSCLHTSGLAPLFCMVVHTSPDGCGFCDAAQPHT